MLALRGSGGGSARKGARTRTPTCALSITPETLSEKGFSPQSPHDRAAIPLFSRGTGGASTGLQRSP